MARQRRKATPSTPEARIEAAAIQDARRRGATNAQIGKAWGINERTVRKIIAGETPGTRIYAAKVKPPKAAGTTPNVFRLDMDLGGGMIRTTNVKVPNLPRAGGGTRAPTPFDVFRYPELMDVAEAEGRRMQRQYTRFTGQTFDEAVQFVGLRHIEHRRARRLITIRGTVRA